MGRTEIQLRISELQISRWRVMNCNSMTRVEKENAIWWINQEIQELHEDLLNHIFRKVG